MNHSNSKISFSDQVGFNWDNSYLQLPAVLYERAVPARLVKPTLSILNSSLAKELGLNFDLMSESEMADVFSGQVVPVGAEPIAQAYAGHQYGGFSVLGDGRAILLGEHVTPTGARVDIQFKGSGPTPYSRRGDGLAVLGPMLREYLISEAMFRLGIPTTRSLAVVTTGEQVRRERMLPGAVLTRIAASHIRVGTFQLLAAYNQHEALKPLADYTIDRHYRELADAENPYLDLLLAVIARQAHLIARWQQVGFVHGVMNTDNMAISGETIDYGPCAFMDAYHLDTVFSSIDDYGRYAYKNQPVIAQWNLARFAETLLPLLDSDYEKSIALATAAIQGFKEIYEQAWLDGMRKKFGLLTEEADDLELIESFFEWAAEAKADFTNTFRDLAVERRQAETSPLDPKFTAWHSKWQQRLERNGCPISESYKLMNSVNPFIIPRNHRVEEALSAAQDENDLSLFHRLLAALEFPYEERNEFAEYRSLPTMGQSGYRTFCGT